MNDEQQTYDTIYDSKYCICAHTPNVYLLFFEKMIQKYLSDAVKNYQIIVSTTDNLLPLYKNAWPNHERLIYESHDLIPNMIPNNNNNNIIYIYHHNTKLSSEQQMNLIEFVESHPNMKYIYIGKIGELLPFTRFKLFRYYLHFETMRGQWGGIHSRGIIKWKTCRAICKKYRSQNQKKNKKDSSTVIMYDYYVIHDIQLDQSKLGRFNKKIIKIKKKPEQKSTIMPSPTLQITKPKIKYIYTQTRNTPFLIMPNGTNENYNELILKYKDIIEI
jgi:hypothetical protein